jgi:integrase
MTGMSRGEVLTLSWCQIRDGFIYLDPKYNAIKTREARQIPISNDLEALFARIRAEQNPKADNVVDFNGRPINKVSSEYIFTYQGKPFKGI